MKNLLLRSQVLLRGGTRFFSAAVHNSNQKEKMVVLGSGWAGYNFARNIDKNKFNVSLVSPRNHFLFTPLLPSTSVGTLEFRAIQEPVRLIKGVQYLQAECIKLDTEKQKIVCKEVFKDDNFELEYDKLVIATGSTSNTFGVEGITESNHVYFLKQLQDARKIRNRIIECFERASYPNLDESEVQQLLSFVIVGGGPTSVEFTAEFEDFLFQDVKKWYPDLVSKIKVSLVEASPNIMGSFSEYFVNYTHKTLENRGCNILTGTSVKSVNDGEAILSDGSKLPFGLMVWSTGNKQVPFIDEMEIEKGPSGRLIIDDKLKLTAIKNGSVYAMGDCAALEKDALPTLAQVAQQQSFYLSNVLNKYDNINDPKIPVFNYFSFGSMAQIGKFEAVFESPLEKYGLAGVSAFLMWRSAYWTKAVSITNKILIPMYWFKAFFFGRDISRF